MSLDPPWRKGWLQNSLDSDCATCELACLEMIVGLSSAVLPHGQLAGRRRLSGLSMMQGLRQMQFA